MAKRPPWGDGQPGSPWTRTGLNWPICARFTSIALSASFTYVRSDFALLISESQGLVDRDEASTTGTHRHIERRCPQGPLRRPNVDRKKESDPNGAVARRRPASDRNLHGNQHWPVYKDTSGTACDRSHERAFLFRFDLPVS